MSQALHKIIDELRRDNARLARLLAAEREKLREAEDRQQRQAQRRAWDAIVLGAE